MSDNATEPTRPRQPETLKCPRCNGHLIDAGTVNADPMYEHADPDCGTFNGAVTINDWRYERDRVEDGAAWRFRSLMADLNLWARVTSTPLGTWRAIASNWPRSTLARSPRACPEPCPYPPTCPSLALSARETQP